VLPEWITLTPPVKAFAANGTNPLNFVSHSRGSLHLVTFQTTSWSGWVRPGPEGDGYSIVTSAQLWVEKGRALNPETLGGKKSDYAEAQSLFYEVLVERIVQDRVGFVYRNLITKNLNGTVNLSAPSWGRFILQPGNSMMLATGTLDVGTSVTVTLNEIR
jgi:hypothetical protein